MDGTGFGQADLSSCEREQIHLAASIQPIGALLVVRPDDGVVIQASAAAAEVLGLDESPLGRSVESLGDLWARIQPHLDGGALTEPVAVRTRIGSDSKPFDALLHHPPEGGIIIELEPAGEPIDLSAHVVAGLRAIMTAASVRALTEETVRIVTRMTGFDRVMVYRFDDAGHGEVFSEQHRPGLESFRGNRYPATDIPYIARRLYERNRVRQLADVAYVPEPLVPRLSPLTGQDLDMSRCSLRSMSPIHLQYLKNMGVVATLVVSLMVGGKLWGLIACHHYEKRVARYEIRAACALLAETIATRIAALESFAQGQSELAVRRLERRMTEAIQREGDWRIALFDGSGALLQPVGASGAALLFEGQTLTAGEVPATPHLRALAGWLDQRQQWPVFDTASLSLDAPEFGVLVPIASGLLATRVSSVPGEYLIWFRPEVISTVTWAGDPFKPLAGDTAADLSPRRSFAQWHQQVEGTAEKWSRADLAAARLIGESITDVILQFRAVRMLVARDQLEQVARQVRMSDQPVVISDTGGLLLLRNDAFRGLPMRPGVTVERLEDLPGLFVDRPEVARRLNELRTQRRAWRGEVLLDRAGGPPQPFMVRGDVVLAAPDRVLGFVLFFSDLTQRHAADAARLRFQEDILQRRHALPNSMATREALLLQSMLGSVVENAQLAALEITDGLDLARMPEMLDCIRDSLSRAEGGAQALMRHAAAVARDSA